MSAHLDLAVSGGDAAASLASVLETILSTDVVIFEKRDHLWSARARAVPGSRLPEIHRLAGELDTVSSVSAALVSEPWNTEDDVWTLVGCKTRLPMVIAIQGDWGRAPSLLVLVARNFALLLEAQRTSARARAHFKSQRLARRLSLTTGLKAVGGMLVREMAGAVGARIAALAVSDPVDRHLSIVATHGYPIELVEHLTIDQHEGVLGSVYQSGRPLHVRRIPGAEGSRQRRPRYRTDSFIAMPIRAGKDVLGIMCVTDRLHDEAFTRDHVATLHALAAPAALALGRERAVVRAESFAQTAAIDPVSGIFNRRHFHVRLEEELQRAKRHELPLAFLMIDMDSFKSINDSFGHLAGDAVIRDVADILRRSVRVFDVCARFGGDEFAIIMPGSVVASASHAAERIRERVERYRPTEPGLRDVRLTASIGLAVLAPGLSSREFIARADQALYMAKHDGKNLVRVHREDSPKILDAGDALDREADS